jgi:hypothetical protein
MHPTRRPLLLTAVALISIAGWAACGDAPTVPERAYTPSAALVLDVAPPVIAAAGDIAKCSSAAQDEATGALLGALPEATVLTLGDNAYPDGTATDFANCYNPSWGPYKDRTRPSPGNHDYHTIDAAGYFGYFGDLAGPPGLGYYSFDIGAWHVISLNSEAPADEGSAQLAWLREDLAANPTACTLAYWHHPVFSSGRHGNSSRMRTVWGVLDAAGADVALVAHDHMYERFAPQTSTGVADPNGIRSFVVGTGGAELYTFETIRDNSEVREQDTWGVLKMTLHADGYDWEFVPIAGQTFTDAGSAKCVEMPPPPPNEAPTVSLTEPTDGASYTAPATITLQATAADADGTVKTVDFFQGTTLLGTDDASPFELVLTEVAEGNYSFTAVATDDDDAQTTSGAITVTVNPEPPPPPPPNQAPTVSLTEPTDGASYTAPATITLRATAADADGTVRKVEFFQGTTLLRTDEASPYEFTWSNVGPGSYSLTAVATDNAAARTISAVVRVTVCPHDSRGKAKGDDVNTSGDKKKKSKHCAKSGAGPEDVERVTSEGVELAIPHSREEPR